MRPGLAGPLAVLACAVLLAAPPRAGAITVFDPANYAQNLLQAARALSQIENQLRSLQNESALLAGQARNLAPLGSSAASGLSADMARVNALLAQAGRLAGDVAAMRRAFEADYGVVYAPGSAEAELAAMAEARWLNSVEALRRALEVQAEVTGSLARTQAAAETLASRSQAAPGALAALQAGNEVLVLQAKQLSDLTVLLAAQGRAHALEQARAAAAAADARARLRRFLEPRR